MTRPFTLDRALAALDRLAPFNLAEPWDNVGLMVGDPGWPVTGIMTALDPTEDLLVEARESNCNLIVTHHPLIFQPLKSIRPDQPAGRLLAAALAAEIAIIACHTNLDTIAPGVSDILARRLGLGDPRPLTTPAVPPTAASDLPRPQGFGRIGCLPAPVPGQQFLNELCRQLAVDALTLAGRLPEMVRTVAVCGGSGSDLAEIARAQGADLYLSAEIKHSVARWAEAADFCVIDAGHFATENLIVPELAARLAAALAAEGVARPVLTSRRQRAPLKFYRPSPEEQSAT